MIYLLLSIISSTGIFVLFKLFNKYRIDTMQAIIVNYFFACLVGILLYDGNIETQEIIQSNWFYATIGLGFLFITIFNVMALTAQKNGLSVASVASKMSVIIPVLFGLIILNESIGVQKLIGIILALFAVYLTSTKKKEKTKFTKTFYLPILLFLGSGVIDTSINYFAPDDKIPLFSALIFAFAFIIGILIIIYRLIVHKNYFQLKSIPLGALLGIVNYASIYFLLKALRIENLESSTLFTVNNVAIVALSTLVGLILFKERISVKNWIGIFVAFVSIILVTLT
ncbi:MAG: EamA family transporter [Winogradskyella sp.]|uniref:EamA family transporter n=1 Tax=Winogradskyella sp. TaxID=1883156 RepID=UPI0018353DA8|nr:EamA family transporter [Winogradskyella sp.]